MNMQLILCKYQRYFNCGGFTVCSVGKKLMTLKGASIFLLLFYLLLNQHIPRSNSLRKVVYVFEDHEMLY